MAKIKRRGIIVVGSIPAIVNFLFLNFQTFIRIEEREESCSKYSSVLVKARWPIVANLDLSKAFDSGRFSLLFRLSSKYFRAR